MWSKTGEGRFRIDPSVGEAKPLENHFLAFNIYQAVIHLWPIFYSIL